MKRVKLDRRFLRSVKGIGCGAVVILGAIQFAVAGSGSYSVLDLGTLPGGTNSYATGINNNGQVVGWSTTASGYTHAFLYSGGAMTDLGTLPGGSSSEAYGINNNGQVVGWSYTSSGATHAFVYSGGAMTNLGTLAGCSSSAAYGINDNGQVVGSSSGGTTNAFLYSGGQMTNLGHLPVSPPQWPIFMPVIGAAAYGINNNGQVVGCSYTGSMMSRNPYVAFLYSGGVWTDLGALPGYSQSFASGINSNGQVVGYLYTMSLFGSASYDAFLYSGGTMVDLNTLIPANSGWDLEYASAINDNGQICGYGTNPSGQTDAFLLTPVPEPATWGLLLLGGVGFMLRKRR
jgi:probable HAF family extracellular repeat protein